MAYFKARVGSSGGNEPVLLWTNPNPTSVFEAQLASIDTTTYKYFIIKYKTHATAANSTEYIYYFDTVNYNRDETIYRYPGFFSYWGGWLCNRLLESRSTGIYFYESVKASNNSASGTDNYTCIPIEIYGLKNAIF